MVTNELSQTAVYLYLMDFSLFLNDFSFHTENNPDCSECISLQICKQNWFFCVYSWQIQRRLHSQDKNTSPRRVCFDYNIYMQPEFRKGQPFEWICTQPLGRGCTAVQINWQQLASRCFDYRADRSSSAQFTGVMGAENTIKDCFLRETGPKHLNKSTRNSILIKILTVFTLGDKNLI